EEPNRQSSHVMTPRRWKCCGWRSERRSAGRSDCNEYGRVATVGQETPELHSSRGVGSNPPLDPIHKALLPVMLSDVQWRSPVVIPGAEIGSIVNEQCQCLRSSVPLGREMRGRQASWATCVDIRAMRDQPGNRAVRALKSKHLQRTSATRHAT